MKPSRPVSAVVCNYNGALYLPECIDALLAQETDLDELIVVDNCSTDDSVALMAERYPDVRVIEMPSNDGPSSARNAGMRAARNRWVLAVDNDAMLAPDVLTKLLAAADEREDVSALQPRSVFHHDPSRVHYDGGAAHYAGLVALRNFYRPASEAVGEGVVDVDVVISVCLLVDRDMVMEVGGYDERYFILFEDLDLSYRLRLSGRALVCVEDAIVLHRAGTPGVSFREGTDYPASRVFYHSRNRWLYMAKCFRCWTLFVALPGLIVYEAVWFLFAVLQGGLFAWLRGKWAVLSTLGEVCRMRKEAQRLRKVPDRELLVGGPLTLTPGLKAGGLSGLLARALDGALRLWWGVVRRIAA